MTNNQNSTLFYKMFLENLYKIYYAENQILQILPKIMNAISSTELQKTVKIRFEEAKEQKKQLEKIFTELKELPTENKCEGIKGLLRECEHISHHEEPGLVRDADLISALQKVQHYQIATYGALRSFAKHLELDIIREYLQQILDGEWKTDKKLTTLAEGGWFRSGINKEALR